MLLNYQISFKCSECGQLIDSLHVFEKHIWTYHLNDFAYRCAICGLPCLTVEALTGHFATHHEGHTLVEYKRKIEQEQKLKELLASSIFVAIKISYESGYEQDGSTTFSDSLASISPQVEPMAEEYLQDDMQYTEQGEYSVNVTEPFDEPVDEFLEAYTASTFSNAEYMEERTVLPNDENFFVENNSSLYDGHAEQQQQSLANENKQLPTVSSPERMTTFYKCDICGKMLKYLSKVEEHRRSHTGEKPFSCSYCDKKFTQRGALRCHERLHTGEKPFVCSWDCGKAFVSSSAKMMHERTHAGIRRFSCSYCGQLFGKKYHVERHEKRHKRIIANSTNLYKGDSATGLDAAGEYLHQLLHPVTDVVDSVRLKKIETKSRRVTSR